jgi:environmental stress-induced protein Ves
MKEAIPARHESVARVVRLDELPVSRWKNGGGATRELARAELPDGSGFAWRLSVADIERPGPFSDFRGYRRQLVLLDGTGLYLGGPGTRGARLDEPGDVHVFDGADEISATLHGGPCRDVNIMTAHAAACHWEIQLLRGAPLDIAGEFVLFPVRGRWQACVTDGTDSASGESGSDGTATGRRGERPAAAPVAEQGTALVHLHTRSAISLGCAGGGVAILLRLQPNPAR